MQNPKQIESINSGSNYNFGDKMTIANTPRSLFDLTHLNTLTIDNAGEVIPIDVIETLPNDDFDITVNSLVRVMPQVVPLYSRQRMYIYAFYSRGGDLWSEFNTFMTKGYTGDEILEIPTQPTQGNDNINKCEPNSLADYMGIPIGTPMQNLAEYKNILPEMMYIRIWRDYFINKNYYTQDRAILPNNDADFRLNKNGKLQSLVDTYQNQGQGNLNFDSEYKKENNIGIKDGNFIVTKFYHDYPQDYFTSALPWPQRGKEPTTQINVNKGNVQITFNNFKGNLTDNNNTIFKLNAIKGGTQQGPVQVYTEDNTATFSMLGGENTGLRIEMQSDIQPQTWEMKNLVPNINGTTNANITGALGNITLNQIRELAIAQTELEKMARTDGSYGEFGLTFFGEKSKRADDYKPVYIGGSVTNLQFTEVVQQSESNTTPLGTYAGHGIATQTDGYLGHIHCDDYGYIMILACIMPDVYYSQGLDKKFTRLYQSQYYLPERAKLGLQPILNQELVFMGEGMDDQELWAYQNPFDEYRYKNNEIHGKIADNNNQSFYPYTQARHFPSLPNWSEEFANASEVRKDYLSAPEENAYTAQFNIQIRAIRPLPYKPIPAQILN